jgi:hypothetical protein
MESVPGFFQWKIFPGSPNEIKVGALKLVLKYNDFLLLYLFRIDMLLYQQGSPFSWASISLYTQFIVLYAE